MSEVQHLSISLWNANGLRITTVHEVLSHCLSSTLLFITETWLLSPSLLPTDWMQYHVYGVPVPSANRGSMGVTALVSPSCPFPVSQLPSPNRYTLSLKVGPYRFHCLYVPPPLSIAEFMTILSSIPSLPNTFICGDLTGDALVSPRGAAMARWLAGRPFTVLNGSLAHGVSTWVGFRDDREMNSIIDLFLTNASLMSPHLDIASDLSLGSDHRLLTLSFSFAQSSAPEPSSDTSDFTLHPRRLWNLSRLGEPDPCQLYQDTFRSSSAPLLSQLKRLVQHPPPSRPPIDDLNASLNDIIYRSLDSSVGDRPPRPSHWKKYWTQQLQDAADFRNRCYRRWRRAFGIDKVYWWHQHQQANTSFRQAVATAKRLSWQAFCKSLESDFTKAISKVKQLKRRHQSSASFSHPDGPSKAVEIMATHLASVYDGSLLPSTRPTPIPTPSSPLSLGSFGPSPNGSTLLGTSLSGSSFPGSTSFNLSSHGSTPSTTFFYNSPFAPLTIQTYIGQLPTRKAPGTDHIKAEMLKPISTEISHLLSWFFSLCCQWSYVPSPWRHAQVFPIFKKGDPSLPSNYRPISLTSVFRKLLELSLAPWLTSVSPRLDLAQGGFRPRRSALDQALCLHELMQSYYRRSHRFPVVAFLDIKSAYDTVDRRVIWDALSRSGAGSSPCLPLLVHLFDDVSVSVLVSNHSSAPFSPVTGVLQGSVLSPHLYSVYINTLPSLLRQVVAPATHLVPSSGRSDAGMVPVNSLLFADDVAVIGSAKSVKEMLKLCEDHSLSLGYRWNPLKCAVLNHPTSSPSSSGSTQLNLYSTPLPLVDKFVYLGMPFVKTGLSAASVLPLRSPGVLQLMGILNKIGVNRQGFSLLLCARIYSTFVRPKFEYGLAISKFTATQVKEIDRLQDRCLRMMVGGHATSSTLVIKHMTTLPSMHHRIDVLTTRFCLRARSLPGSCLLSLLSTTLPVSRIKIHLEKNSLFLALPSPSPSSDTKLKTFFSQYRERQIISLVTSTTQVLLSACRPALVVDPILYVPATRAERSLLVRWRLGWLPGKPEDCPCGRNRRSRRHFLECDLIPSFLWSDLPRCPPGSYPIDFALSSLPLGRSARCPPWWSSLLLMLWHIQHLCRPDRNLPIDPSPGASWYSRSSARPD
ncbi:unnamed protein product [Rhizopus stolonifer]